MAAPTYTAAKASTLSTDAGGAWAHTTAAPAGAGELIIVHVFQDGTSAADAITIDSATNANKLDGSGTGYSPLRATGFPVGDVNTPTGYHYIFLARATGTNASVITGGNTGTNDIYVRTYQFGGVHAGLDVAHILENVTPGVAVSTAGTSTSVAAVSVTALGTERLALCFIAVADDIQGAELTAMAGESGGDWTYPVAAAGSSTGTDGTLGLVTATPDSGLVITGGADAITSEAWGTLGFALRPTTAVLVHYGQSNTPVTFGAATVGHAITFTYEWWHTEPGESGSWSDIDGATNPTYDIVTDDVGRKIMCEVTATDDGGSSTADSNPTTFIAAAEVAGGVTDTVVTFDAVTAGRAVRHGQVANPTTVTPVVAGRVTARSAVSTPITFGAVTNGSGTGSGQVSLPVTAAVTIQGRVTARGQVAFPVTFDAVTQAAGAITYAYQWQRDTAGNEEYAAIDGATGSTYELQAEDVGCNVRCEVTATDDGGSTIADSNSVGPVASGVTDVYGQVAATFIAATVTNGVRTVHGQVATPITLTPVSAARVTAKSQATTAVTFGAVTESRRVLRGQAAAPFTLERVIAGRVTARGQVALPITATVATNGAITGNPTGQVDSPFTVTPVVTGRVTAKSQVATPVTFGVVTNATRIARGQVAASFTVTPVVTGRVTARGQGELAITLDIMVSVGISFAYQWQRDTLGNDIYADITDATATTYVLEAADVHCNIRCVVTATNEDGSNSADSNSVGPVADVVAGEVAFPVTFAAATDGTIAGTVTGQVAAEFTFGAVTDGTVLQAPEYAAAGLIYMWGDFSAATTGAVILPVTLEPVTTGRVTAKSQVATTVAFGSTTTGRVTARSQVDTQLTFDAVTSGTLAGAEEGQAELPVTVGFTTAGRVTAKAQATQAFTAAIVTAAKVGARGLVSLPVTAAIGTAGLRTVRALVSLPVTVARVATGRVAAYSQVDLPVTVSVRTEGAGQGGAARLPVTATITTSGIVTARSTVALPVTCTVTTNADSIPRVKGQATLPVTVGFTTTGTVDAHSQASTIIPALFTTVGHVDAHSTVAAVFAFTSTANGRHVRYGSLTLPLHAVVSVRGITSLPGVPTIGQLLHNRIQSLGDTTTGHLENSDTGHLEEVITP